MKKTLPIILILILTVGTSQAAFEDWQSGIRPNGMAGAYTAVADDIEAVRWNPAGLSAIESWQASVYAKKLWGVAGLYNQTLGLGKKVGKWGVVAVSAQQVGCDLETDQTLTLSHGFDLNNQLAFGYNFNFYRLWQDRFGSAMTTGIDIGMLAKVYRNWRVGCFGHNLNHPGFGKISRYELPSGVSVGLSYTPFSGVLASIEAEKEAGRVTRYKVGSEYEFWPKTLNIRAGILNEGQLTLYSMGFEARAKGISVGYAFEGGHQALSGNHQFGLGYRW
jgi:hypothetical protein